MAFRWHEAVAIAQGLCCAINESRDPVTEGELELTQVFVDPEGTISLDARPDPAAALPRVRKLLLEMLPPNEFAQAEVLPDSSLEDFSRALKYYERPDRAEVIQSVRGRWRASPVKAVEQIVEPQTTHKSESEKKDVARSQWVPRLVAAAALCAATGGVAVWALSTPHLEAKIRSQAAALSSNVNSATAGGSPSSTSGKPAATRSERPVTVRTPTPKSGFSAQPRAEVQTAGATDHLAVPEEVVVSGLTRSAPASSNQPAAPSVAGAPSAPNAEPADSAVSAQVFDATQRDVVPPAFLSPDSRTPLAPGASQKDAATLEVTVNERGTVDAVKASSSPRSLAESMQLMSDLSAAKNWRFRPAMRDGRPVKYRLIVPIIAR